MNFAGAQSASRKRRHIFLIVFMAIIAVGELFPLLWLFDFSLAKSGDLFASNILIWPDPPQWQNYVDAFQQGNVLHFFLNSLLVNSVTMFVTVIVSLMAAYACIRMKWKWSRTVLNILLLGMMIPIYATLLPNFIIFNTLKLTDTVWGLLIPYIAFSLPQGMFVMSGFLDSVPHELEESAVIDGCGIFSIIFRIVFPLVKPAAVTIAIMTFFNNWNEFIMAMTYLSSDTWKTLPFSVLSFAGQYSSSYAVQFAVMALSALPALVVYILLNKQITKGMVFGAVKG
jgi:ABC-type sugar transport system, permease component